MLHLHFVFLLHLWASGLCDDSLAVQDNWLANFENSHSLVCDVFLVYLTRPMMTLRLSQGSHTAHLAALSWELQYSNYALAFVIIITATASSASAFLLMHILAEF